MMSAEEPRRNLNDARGTHLERKNCRHPYVLSSYSPAIVTRSRNRCVLILDFLVADVLYVPPPVLQQMHGALDKNVMDAWQENGR